VNRGLRLACSLAVAAWCAVFLAGAVVTLPELSTELHTERPPLARVRPVLERPKPPLAEEAPRPAEEEPPPAAEPPRAEPALAAEPRPVGRAEVVRGAALLDSGGSFPVLSFDYDAFPSFRSYARAMVRLGARFVIVHRRAIVGSLDLETGAIGEFSGAARFSPRARDYTGEPGLDALARVARERFGERAVVMMLVPRSLDAGIFGGLAQVIEERGQRRDALREIRGRYERAAGGGVHLRVDAALRRDGSSVPIQTLFDLGQIAGASA